MKNKPRIMIVEDHAIFREGLKRVIEQIESVEFAGEAENGEVFLSMVKKADPDIVLMDIKMPVMDGIMATEKALKINPALRIIVLTMFGEEEYLFTMIRKGITGFILKNARVSEIEAAIHAVRIGEQYYSPAINGLLAKKLKQFTSHEISTFTRRENEVLHLLCKGLSTLEISERLNISIRTVEGHRSRLLEKTSQPNVINLIIYAFKNRMVTMEELENKE
jgi:DNA-binding NarL/FixJ family response regulator